MKQLFLCYSRTDQRIKDILRKHLSCLEANGSLQVLDDSGIEAGSDWSDEIDRMLRSCNGAVLLVSAAALGSKIIIKNEMPVLLERRGSGALHLYGLLASPGFLGSVDWLERLELRPRGKKYLSEFSKRRLERELSGFVEEISVSLKLKEDKRLSTAETDGLAALLQLAPRKTVPRSGVREIDSRRTQSLVLSSAAIDEENVILGQQNGTLKRLNIETGKVISAVSASNIGGVSDIAVIPQKRELCAACIDGSITLWDIDLTKEMGRLEGHSGPVRKVVVTPNGRAAISASGDGTIRFWDLDSKTQIGVPLVEGEGLSALALTPDGRALLYGGTRGLIKILSFSKPGEPDTIVKDGYQYLLNGKSASALAVGCNGSLMAVGCTDGTVSLWDLQSRKLLTSMTGHRGEIRDIHFSESGGLLASASSDRTVRLWNSMTGKEVNSISHSSWATSISFLPGTRVVSTSIDGGVYVWDLQRTCPDNLIRQHHGRVRALAAAQSQVVSASFDGSVKLWDTKSELQIGQEFLAEPIDQDKEFARNEVSDVAITADATYIVSGHSDGVLRLWDTKSKGCVQFPEDPRKELRDIFAVAISEDAKNVISGSEDRVIRVWSVTDPHVAQELRGHTGGVNSVAISRDKRYVVSAADDQTVRVWLRESGAQVRMLAARPGELSHDDEVLDVAISPSGDMIMSASKDRTIKIWDLESGALIKELCGHTNYVLAVAFAPDEKWAASVSVDRELKLWDLATGKQFGSYCSEAPLFSCTVAADGSVIVVGDDAGYLHFLEVKKL